MTRRSGADAPKHTPGPWAVGYRSLDIGCENAKIGGYTKLFDVRGWGYLTGHGHGALRLDPDEAVKVQEANARLAAAAPELLDALKSLGPILKEVHENWDQGMRSGKLLIALMDKDLNYRSDISKIHAAIAKAEGGAE